jgi:hypothetical protein
MISTTDGEKEVLSPRRQGTKEEEEGGSLWAWCLEAKPGERMGFFDRINRMVKGLGMVGDAPEANPYLFQIQIEIQIGIVTEPQARLLFSDWPPDRCLREEYL